MNEHLKLAIEAMAEVEKLAAEKETEAMNFAVSFAQALAAIAQAEAAERLAVAWERIIATREEELLAMSVNPMDVNR